MLRLPSVVRALYDRYTANPGRWLGPVRCLLCSDLTEGELALCLPCRRELPWIGDCCRVCALPLPGSFDRIGLLCGQCQMRKPALDRSWIPFHYTRPVSNLVLHFKAGGDLVAGRTLARLLLMKVLTGADTDPSRPPVVLPIPLHPTKLRQRGFNQALELARPLVRATGWPLRANLLQRHRQTPAFQGLSAAVRRRYARDLFTVRELPGIDPGPVLLVDDVLTTGATANSAARALKKCNFGPVWLAAVARTGTADDYA